MDKESNVVFLYGNDEFSLTRRLAEFRSGFSDPSGAEMNTARLDARSMSEDELNNAVNSMPFLAKHRLVLLANPSARYTSPSARKRFLEFLGKTPPTTRLVMYEPLEIRARPGREEERHWLIKWMQQSGLGLERFALPAPRDMTGWIIQQAKEQGGSLEGNAAAKLAELSGADPRQAAQEIAKLLAYVNWSRPVQLADVEAVSIATAEPDIFAMVDALAEGQGRSAQKLLHGLLENEDAFSVWGMVVRQFRLLLQARELMDARGGQPEIERALGVPGFVAGKILSQARRFSAGTLEGVYHRLLEIDEAAKTGQVALDLALETLVVELTT